jgi:hypothetical protein
VPSHFFSGKPKKRKESDGTEAVQEAVPPFPADVTPKQCLLRDSQRQRTERLNDRPLSQAAFPIRALG